LESELAPYELLAELLEEAGMEADHGMIMGLRQKVMREREREERLRREVLEEVRAEAMAARGVLVDGGGSKPRGKKGGGRKRGSKGKAKKGGKQGSRAKVGRMGKDDTETLQTALSELSVEEDQAGMEGGEQQEEEGAEYEEEEQECSICFVELGVEDEGVCRLSCSHLFHHECLDRWAGRCSSKNIESTCPLCRAPLCH